MEFAALCKLLAIPEHFVYCESLGRLSVPFSFFMLLTSSDIFLVVNSSVNFVVYCCVGKEFRHEVWRMFTRGRC